MGRIDPQRSVSISLLYLLSWYRFRVFLKLYQQKLGFKLKEKRKRECKNSMNWKDPMQYFFVQISGKTSNCSNVKTCIQLLFKMTNLKRQRRNNFSKQKQRKEAQAFQAAKYTRSKLKQFKHPISMFHHILRAPFKILLTSGTFFGLNILNVILNWLATNETVQWRYHSGTTFFETPKPTNNAEGRAATSLC